MPMFRKKPVVIEAVQFIPGFQESAAMIEGREAGNILYRVDALGHMALINTPEGQMQAREGDWIIRGVKGEFSPCKPEIFELTYEEVIEFGTESYEFKSYPIKDGQKIIDTDFTPQAGVVDG